MAYRNTKDVAASVHQRLLNLSRLSARPFDALLQHYGLERFLYRLSMTSHVKKLVLKGGLLMVALEGQRSRTTRDADFSSTVKLSRQELVDIVSEICTTPVEDDGLDFGAATISPEEIAGQGDTPGVRLKFTGHLGNALVHIRVDVGFGNVIVPEPVEMEFPVLLDHRPPRILVYGRETIVAEKFHAAVKLVPVTSRMNDFYDVWKLSQSHEFDGIRLQESVKATFENRRTSLDLGTEVFSEEFASDADRETLWRAFLSRKAVGGDSTEFVNVMGSYREFLQPLAQACSLGRQFRKQWLAGGPWR